MGKQLKAATIVNKLGAAVAQRVQALKDNETHVATEFKGILACYAPDGNNRGSFERAIESVKDQIDFDFLIKIIGKHAETGKNDPNYVQAKTIVKINRLLFGLATKDMRALDNHSRSLIVNATLNGKLSSKAAFATLVRVQWGEEIEEALRERNNYSAGTGSTQLSSTKEMMRVLGLSDNPKGTKNADFAFTDEARTLLCERFARLAELVKTADKIDAELDAAIEEAAE
jgi:hypothetical protein